MRIRTIRVRMNLGRDADEDEELLLHEVNAPLVSAVCDHGSTAWSRRRSERARCAV